MLAASEEPYVTDVLFADDIDGEATPNEHRHPWHVLIVDDEEDVHAVTKLVLDQLEYNGRRVNLHHAYSAQQAKEFLDHTPDVALIILDVVMESDDAGLRLVEHIRHERKNKVVRIVLRTGQPGQAPERRVIRDYDINDYKSKTEFTATKLYTTTLTALRAYEDMVTVEMSRRGLEKILEASSSLFQERAMHLFASGVLTQISALLGISREGILCVYQGGLGTASQDELFVMASAGDFERINGSLLDSALEQNVADSIIRAMREQESVFEDDATSLYFETPSERKIVVYLKSDRTLTDLERQLVEVFCRQVSVALDNLHMFEDLAKAHEELKLAHVATVVLLADVAELRDPETGAHVLRVARMSENIARKMQQRSDFALLIDESFVEAIGLASIMHDVGKVITPDHILQKPGGLDDNERLIMQKHAEIGRQLLAKATTLAPKSLYLELGAEIAGGHHEWFDGKGYPLGTKGSDIPLSARIVAVADVFDALTHSRVYKSAWPVKEAIAYIIERGGTQFDPAVVAAFLELQDENG